jgi:hypothetical protein
MFALILLNKRVSRFILAIKSSLPTFHNFKISQNGFIDCGQKQENQTEVLSYTSMDLWTIIEFISK